VAEWTNAVVLKTAEVQASVGSNPTPSATHLKTPLNPSWRERGVVASDSQSDSLAVETLAAIRGQRTVLKAKLTWLGGSGVRRAGFRDVAIEPIESFGIAECVLYPLFSDDLLDLLGGHACPSSATTGSGRVSSSEPGSPLSTPSVRCRR
jgi:hypothetical protein